MKRKESLQNSRVEWLHGMREEKVNSSLREQNTSYRHLKRSLVSMSLFGNNERKSCTETVKRRETHFPDDSVARRYKWTMTFRTNKWTEHIHVHDSQTKTDRQSMMILAKWLFLLLHFFQQNLFSKQRLFSCANFFSVENCHFYFTFIIIFSIICFPHH